MTSPSDPGTTLLREIRARTRVVACVGFSANPARPSNSVSRYLQGLGIKVVPVNPGLAGQSFLGEEVFADLSAIPDSIPVDMVDVFRRSEHVAEVVDDALNSLPHLRTIWTQLGVEDDVAAAKARARGVDVVQNRCPAIEFPRLAATTS